MVSWVKHSPPVSEVGRENPEPGPMWECWLLLTDALQLTVQNLDSTIKTT